ncbi:MAG: hypothetical protein KJ072_06200 [Verrucomicrobia bacterium]|nr:hypothetical protein [Verrucomicrobiota bacterium]
MHTVHFEEIVDKIVQLDRRYASEAYYFVREALDHTQQSVHKSAHPGREAADRHVTGQQLLEGIRLYALKSFGPMSIFTLREFGVQSCEDFGEIVFNLVEHGQGMFGKTEQDTRDDFKPGYDFEVAFRHPFLPIAKLTPPPAPANRA